MEKEFKKLMVLQEDAKLAIFDELREINGLLEGVIKAIDESRVTEVSVNNQEKMDMSGMESGMESLRSAIESIKIPEPKETKIDLSGVEKLLNRIAEKKDKEVDVSELKSISKILGDVLYAVQTMCQMEHGDKGVDLTPLLSILNLINDNIVSIEFPDFDYDRLERIVKLIDIQVGGGGSTAKLEQQIANVTLNDNQFRVTQYDSFGYEDSNPKTAFGDLRTAELTPVLQFSFEYTVDNTELTTQIKTGSGTVTQADAMAVASTGTTTASVGRMICHQHVRYRAGLGGLMRYTALFTTGVAGTSQWVGLLGSGGSSADFQNGLAVGYNGATFGVARFVNDSLSFTALSDCDDPLDGTGKSGMTLDPTKLNIFFIQYQYLGAGAIKFFVENGKGNMVLFHTIEHANANTVPSVYNPNFHLTMYANNKATTSNMTVKSASMAYFVEGKTSIYETHQFSKSSGRQSKAAVTTETALFTIRVKSTYNSKTNLITIRLDRLTAGIEASSPNNLAAYRIVRNATLGGSPSYADINTANSIVDMDVAGTTVTGGDELLSGELAGKNDKAVENLTPYQILMHPGDTITIAVSSVNSASINGSLMWRELF